ncbi:hypothetical protein BJ138DRAFT_1117251 [Hygrophoropsis aurantiaca]|uniref:Uncharacterized protein n=1 Tax=Hygrophoropsis aurantiaca TaxID=72124 RepID=A0ACB8A0E5_9AGAM|nr:hypothetical protein BJ138DRAFT_1117251 [Hygrophoropsis aurantiaca]
MSPISMTTFSGPSLGGAPVTAPQSLSTSSGLTLPSPPSPLEAKRYYAGLPSAPILVARTSSITAPWMAPGPGPHTERKELRTVGNHAPKLKDVWESSFARKVHALLDAMHVQWTSTDVVRIVESSLPYSYSSSSLSSESAPVTLWIGVRPASLEGEEGVVVAAKCRALLVEADIVDVEVEICESVVTRSAGPGSRLLSPVYSSDPTADAREPLTPTLGLPICAQATANEGTGGFFIVEGGNTDSGRLLLVTARHVVFPPDIYANTHFDFLRNNDAGTQPRERVTLFSDITFNKYLESIKAEIAEKKSDARRRERRIRAIGEGDYPAADTARKEALADTFYQDVFTHWATPESRVLGHVILSPPINVGVGSSSEGYTEDWAVIEIDDSKVDVSNFYGNAIDLGTRVSEYEFTCMMCPSFQDFQSCSFAYPYDRLLRLEGTIPDEEMCHSTALDRNDDGESLIVLKRGGATGLTVGRANNVCSYTRIYDSDNIEAKPVTSKEHLQNVRNEVLLLRLSRSNRRL